MTPVKNESTCFKKVKWYFEEFKYTRCKDEGTCNELAFGS